MGTFMYHYNAKQILYRDKTTINATLSATVSTV